MYTFLSTPKNPLLIVCNESYNLSLNLNLNPNFRKGNVNFRIGFFPSHYDLSQSLLLVLVYPRPDSSLRLDVIPTLIGVTH